MKRVFASLKEWGIVLLLSLVLALSFKAFLFDVFVVPTSSMVSTLLPGDVILVNKLTYGPKITSSPLSLPFVDKYIPFTKGVHSYSDIIRFPYLRIPGYGEVRRNDLLVFHYPLDNLFPVDHRTYFVKRCIGLPGENLQVVNDVVSVDGKPLEDENFVSYPYFLESSEPMDELIETLDIYQAGRIHNQNTWELVLNDDCLEPIQNDPRTKKLKRVRISQNQWDDQIFPGSAQFKWNLSNFGPVYVPKSGDTLKLTEENIELYRGIISDYEEHQLQVSPEGEIIIDKIPVTTYTVEMDYYFVLGDNRHNSSDSRYWGLLPEDHLVGKASLIVYSIDQKGFKWNRFLKSVYE